MRTCVPSSNGMKNDGHDMRLARASTGLMLGTNMSMCWSLLEVNVKEPPQEHTRLVGSVASSSSGHMATPQQEPAPQQVARACTKGYTESWTLKLDTESWKLKLDTDSWTLKLDTDSWALKLDTEIWTLKLDIGSWTPKFGH